MIFIFLLVSVSGLQELTDDTFVDFVKEPDTFCVMFYSPSCQACIEALPVFRRVAAQLAMDLPGFRMGQIDVVEHSASGDRYDVWDYPTIIVDGEKFPYQHIFVESMESKVLEAWIKRLGHPDFTPPTSNLLILDKDGFERCIRVKVCVVQFTHSRCLACNARKNHIHGAANNIPAKVYYGGVRIAQLDLYKYPEIGLQYGVRLQGFVEHRIFSFGDMYPYYATDDWHGMVEHATSRLKPPVDTLLTLREYRNEVRKVEKDTAVALLLKGVGDRHELDDNTVYKEFYRYVEGNRDIAKYYVIYDEGLLKKLGVTENTLIIQHYFEVVTSHEPPVIKVAVPEDPDASWFYKTFKDHEFGLVNYIDGWRRIKQVDSLEHYVGIYVDDPDWGFKRMILLKEKIGKIARQFQHQILFFIGDISEVSVHFEEVDSINAEVPYHFMVSDKHDRKYTPDLPTLTAIVDEGDDYETYVTSYVTQYLEGRLTPHIKSDEDPGDHDGVIDVTGVSVDRLFNNTQHDILLLMISSNGCRSCQRYEDVFLEFGGEWENPATLIAGMVNTETNELPRPLRMKGSAPHIILVYGNRESPYDGISYFFDDISVEALYEFTKAHGTHPLLTKAEQNIEKEELKKQKQRPVVNKEMNIETAVKTEL